MIKLKAWLLFVTGYICISGETVVLSGVVSNSDGEPVAGASVSLVIKNLTTVTDSKGAYSLSADVAVEKNQTFIPETEAVTIVNNVLIVNLSRPRDINIEMYDMKGNLLECITESPRSAGIYRFDPSTRSFAFGVMILRVQAGSVVTAFRYIPATSGNNLYSTTPALSVLSKKTLTKTAAVIDTLLVTAAGYSPKRVPISSYSEKKDIQLETLTLKKFSFFVTSLTAIQDLSRSEKGFGGDLRFGKTGQGAGLLGADSICECIAERSMPGSGVKQWRAFLSVAKGPNGQKVNAIDRIGNGPWYDRLERVVALTKSDLLFNRPQNIDDDIKDDLPNEDGVPNHRPDPTKPAVDNHLTVTGSDSTGRLFSDSSTCEDWTSTTVTNSKPRSGLSWIRKGFGGFGKTRFSGDFQMMTNMQNWISVWSLPGCEAGIDLEEKTGAGKPGVKTIGSGGGYGGFYCFALTP